MSGSKTRSNVRGTAGHVSPALAKRAAGLAAAGPAWLRRQRREAWDRFRREGFPSARLEDWRDTNVRPIAATPFEPSPAVSGNGSLTSARDALTALGLDGLAPQCLTFVNGSFVSELSTVNGLPPGSQSGSLARVLAERPCHVEPHLGRLLAGGGHAFGALNTALFTDGAWVEIAEGCSLDAPILVLHLAHAGARPTASWARTVVVAGPRSRGTVVELYAGTGDRGSQLTGAVTELYAGDDAALEHCRVQLQDDSAFHVGTLAAELGRNTRLTSRAFDLGGGLTRQDTRAVLAGQGAECDLDGLYVAGGSRHVDNHTTLDHAVPRGQSRELYKGILAGEARAVFNGRIVVRADAQKTDARQSNPNLLLSEQALVHTRPQLEIHADDVKCTHGATIGRLDEDARFYLQCRGLGSEEAGRMLVQAFAGEVLGRVGYPPLRRRLENEVTARLASLPVPAR